MRENIIGLIGTMFLGAAVMTGLVTVLAKKK